MKCFQSRPQADLSASRFPESARYGWIDRWIFIQVCFFHHQVVLSQDLTSQNQFPPLKTNPCRSHTGIALIYAVAGCIMRHVWCVPSSEKLGANRCRRCSSAERDGRGAQRSLNMGSNDSPLHVCVSKSMAGEKETNWGRTKRVPSVVVFTFRKSLQSKDFSVLKAKGSFPSLVLTHSWMLASFENTWHY